MKTFKRQTSTTTAANNMQLDFGAAQASLPKIFEPEFYGLTITSARVVSKGDNVFAVIDLTENESGSRVDTRPLWIFGPNALGGDIVARNQTLICRLLELDNQPTAGSIGSIIPALEGLSFQGRLVLATDSRSGRTYNELADVQAEDAA
jgi:hypothetical protein